MTSTSSPDIRIPGPDHPITITPTGSRVTVTVGDRSVADTTRALTLQESTYPAVHYVPLSDVDPALLQASELTTYCPYKGTASYFSLEGLPDAVWVYREPYDAVRRSRTTSRSTPTA